MQVLRETILCGWPNSKTEVLEVVHAYYDIRDKLTIQDDLVFKGQQVVLLVVLRKEMMHTYHASHISIEGCVRRAREYHGVLAKDVDRIERVYLEMRCMHVS